MGSRGRLSFDLNELPTEDNKENDGGFGFELQITHPCTNSRASYHVAALAVPQRIMNNHAFSHASSVSGFQPFVRSKSAHCLEGGTVHETRDENSINASSSMSNSDEKLRKLSPLVPGSADVHSVKREEGEWSDAGYSADAYGSSNLHKHGKASKVQEIFSSIDQFGSSAAVEGGSSSAKATESVRCESSSNTSLVVDPMMNNQNGRASHTLESNSKLYASMDCKVEPDCMPKQRETKGIESSHALKCTNNQIKRKIDQHDEAKLGKKRKRQTMLLNLEDVKQVGAIKSSTPRRQTFPMVTTTRIIKEGHSSTLPAECAGEKLNHSTITDQKQLDAFSSEGGTPVESSEPKSETECNGDMNYGTLASSRRPNGNNGVIFENIPSIPRQSSLKQPTELRQLKNSQIFSNRNPALNSQSSMNSKLGNKKHLPAKKQTSSNTYQDTSVERLIREVTNEKFWHQPGEADLQCVPDHFESVEEYVRVFEPLLFEECRAQLYSTWEEINETISRDAHIMVRVKNIERRERGWYDVVVLPANECKWTFKEGDVAILSTPRPGSGKTYNSARSKRNNSPVEDKEEFEISGRLVGTVRRHIPLDTRDPPGAILHFYVGDSYNPNSAADNDHILRKMQPKGIWYLSVLGNLATTQREYVALHAFRRLNLQMQAAILQPSPEHFPKYEQQTPAMPDCFTPNFVDYLHGTFNEPQLLAIQWAATHTAAGTSSGTSKKQDPWPFTLVQGPPGTGKTHTVWGMLNVIHLVQYQHYYTSLLKKLAPESYKQANESNSDNVALGSIDEVLQNMDLNLFRTLPKLCPKPRMLVCAPSNAATDELLSRVLDRGFLDGEMKVYQPDVARVGVDSQTRAAQAVSVERRTEQLLVKSWEEVYGWMHQLRTRESHMSQRITCLQRELTVAAAALRSQGSFGVDPDVLVARDQNRDTLLQNLAAVVEGRDKTLAELSRLLILESKFRPGGNFNLEEARASLEASFANEAEIVFTTVSSSGRKLFSRLTHGFDMVVIDEAAQASEAGVLPPLSLGAARCVLVGDPQQLPATVISKAAGTLQYSRSLFERFQESGCPTMLLSVQYRMHPHIRDFPSRHFYQGRLIDSESIAKLPDEIYYKDPLLRPYIFFDITHGRESHRGGSVSYQNTHEAQFCRRLYEHLQKSLKSLGMAKVSVGIITPYKLQLKCLQHEFEDVLNTEEGKDIYINTVDAFQGQERDVIIMSCVRASIHGVGFVADIRRMNVALTRARRALWVMGNANALTQSDDWAALINDAKARNCYIGMDSLPKEFFAPKGQSDAQFPGKVSNMRGLSSSGPRHRPFDMEFRSGTSSEVERSSASANSRNGNYRPFRPSLENSLDEFDQSGDKSRNAWQHGIQKKQSYGIVTRRER